MLKIIETCFFEQTCDGVIVRAFHQNIQGLLNKLDTIEVCIDEFSENGNELDILCFTETFVKKGSENNIQLKQFKFASSFSRNKKRGGVCIMVNKAIDFKVVKLCDDLSLEKDFESCAIDIPLFNCIVVCIYKIPGNSNVSRFIERLDMLLYKLTRYSRKKIILTGDWNIDTLRETNASKELKLLLATYNFTLHIKEPTRLTSCIDHFASNIDNAQGKTHSLYLSDHDTGQTLNFEIFIKKKASPKYWYKRIREINDENENKFTQCLSSLSWMDVFSNEHDINDAFKSFHEDLCLFFNLCFPEKRVKINANYSRPKWISKGIKKSTTVKRELRSLYYRNKTPENRSTFRKYTKLLRKCINKSQKIHNNTIIKTSSNKCRATWNIIKNKADVVKSHDEIETIQVDDICINDPSDIATAFNNFFLNLTTEPNDISIENKFNLNNSLSHSLFLMPCLEQEIVNIIKTLKNTKSVGIDGLPTFIFKKFAKFLAPVLTFLINISFTQGKFPDLLKRSKVSPLHKKNDRKDMNNYRPITLVPIISKIFEKAMHKRITNFFDKHSIIAEEQNGFQRNKSTTLAAYSLIKTVVDNIDKKVPVVSVFFDMSKAFDYVDHQILLKKCEKYGIRGQALSWIQSYLSNRMQCVEINKINENGEVVAHKSPFLYNKSGVPQGSVLGPLLFLIYINDLPEIINYKTILFADDISIIIPNHDISLNFDHTINSVIEIVTTWLLQNKLNVNVKKTAYIQFSNYKTNPPKLNVICQGQEIREVNETKFLGITLDNHCNWKSHISNICTRLSQFIYALKRLRCTAGESAALTAYHGYVASILRYGLILWGNSSDIEKVFILQKKCLRAICGAGPIETCRPLFKKMRLLTLTGLYILEIGTFVRNNPKLFKHYATVDPRLRPRDTTRLLKTVCTSALYKKNSFAMSIKIYNRIPLQIRQLPTNLFIKCLRTWLIDNCFYNFNEFFDIK